MNYDMIERNFKRGLWNEAQVRMCVRKGIITQDECNAILAGAEKPTDSTAADEILDILEGK